MTTFVPFQPSPSVLFQFQATLDGDLYNIITTWSLYSKRWYLNIFDLVGNLVVSLPLIGSPTGVKLQGLTWRLGKATATTAVPHGLPIGEIVSLNIDGCTPVVYDGDFDVFITGPQAFEYDLAADPGGSATVLGAASRNLNLVAGYFATSTLVFRQQSQQFEIRP